MFGNWIIVLRLHEEERVRRARHPVAAGERLAPMRVDAEVVHATALQLRGSTEFVPLGHGIRHWGRPVLETQNMLADAVLSMAKKWDSPRIHRCRP